MSRNCLPQKASWRILPVYPISITVSYLDLVLCKVWDVFVFHACLGLVIDLLSSQEVFGEKITLFSVSLSKIMLTFPHLSASGSLLYSTVLHGTHFNTLYSWTLQAQALKSGSSSLPDLLIPKLFQLPQLCILLLYAWQFIVLFIQFSNFPCVLYGFVKNICLAFLLLWWLHGFNFRVVVALRDVLWTIPPSISRSSYTGFVLFFFPETFGRISPQDHLDLEFSLLGDFLFKSEDISLINVELFRVSIIFPRGFSIHF